MQPTVSFFLSFFLFVIFMYFDVSQQELMFFLLIASVYTFFVFTSVIFFLVYVLSHNINKKLCRSLILLCEAHFALLYILRLNLVSKLLNQEGSVAAEMLGQLGKDQVLNSFHFQATAFL